METNSIDISNTAYSNDHSDACIDSELENEELTMREPFFKVVEISSANNIERQAVDSNGFDNDMDSSSSVMPVNLAVEQVGFEQHRLSDNGYLDNDFFESDEGMTPFDRMSFKISESNSIPLHNDIDDSHIEEGSFGDQELIDNVKNTHADDTLHFENCEHVFHIDIHGSKEVPMESISVSSLQNGESIENNGELNDVDSVDDDTYNSLDQQNLLANADTVGSYSLEHVRASTPLNINRECSPELGTLQADSDEYSVDANNCDDQSQELVDFVNSPPSQMKARTGISGNNDLLLDSDIDSCESVIADAETTSKKEDDAFVVASFDSNARSPAANIEEIQQNSDDDVPTSTVEIADDDEIVSDPTTSNLAAAISDGTSRECLTNLIDEDGISSSNLFENFGIQLESSQPSCSDGLPNAVPSVEVCVHDQNEFSPTESSDDFCVDDDNTPPADPTGASETSGQQLTASPIACVGGSPGHSVTIIDECPPEIPRLRQSVQRLISDAVAAAEHSKLMPLKFAAAKPSTSVMPSNSLSLTTASHLDASGGGIVAQNGGVVRAKLVNVPPPCPAIDFGSNASSIASTAMSTTASENHTLCQQMALRTANSSSVTATFGHRHILPKPLISTLTSDAASSSASGTLSRSFIGAHSQQTPQFVMRKHEDSVPRSTFVSASMRPRMAVIPPAQRSTLPPASSNPVRFSVSPVVSGSNMATLKSITPIAGFQTLQRMPGSAVRTSSFSNISHPANLVSARLSCNQATPRYFPITASGISSQSVRPFASRMPSSCSTIMSAPSLPSVTTALHIAAQPALPTNDTDIHRKTISSSSPAPPAPVQNRIQLSSNFLLDQSQPKMPASFPPKSFVPCQYQASPPELPNLATPRGGYVCEECNSSFSFISSLHMHLQRQTVFIQFSCLACRATFSVSNHCAYLSHIRVHRAQGRVTAPQNLVRNVVFRSANSQEIEKWFDDPVTSRISDLESLYKFEKDDKRRKNLKINENCEQSIELDAGGSAGVSGNDNILYQCPECRQVKKDKQALRDHFAYNLPPNQKQFICQQCQAVYFSLCSFRAHQRVHSRKVPWVCAECGIQMPSQMLLESHVMSQHRCNPTVLDAWRCSLCSTFYSSYDALMMHLAAAHCETYLKCQACPMAFKKQSAFDAHKANGHVGNNKEKVVCKQISKCSQCDTVFQVRELLVEHLKTHNDKLQPFKVFRCAVCGRLMENKGGLVAHFKNVHRITVNPNQIVEEKINIAAAEEAAAFASSSDNSTVGDKPTSSTQLNAVVDVIDDDDDSVVPCSPTTPANRSSLRGAAEPSFRRAALNKDRSLTPDKRGAHAHRASKFGCNICKTVFCTSEDTLKLHVQNKHSAKSGNESVDPCCHECSSFGFESKEKLMQHIASKHKTKHAHWFKGLHCSSCRLWFANVASLLADGERHLRGGETVCLICDNKPMQSVNQLWLHVYSHVSSKHSFICSKHCRERFQSADAAVQHLMQLHQLDMQCADCGATFGEIKLLAQHIAKCKRVHKRSLLSSSSDGSAGEGDSKKPRRLKLTLKRNSSCGGVTTTKLARFECALCSSYQSQSRSDFQAHIRQHRLDSTCFQCQECGLCFVAQLGFFAHLLTKHQISNGQRYLTDHPAASSASSSDHSRDKDKLMCDVCSEVFADDAALNLHTKTHGLKFLQIKQQRSVSDASA